MEDWKKHLPSAEHRRHIRRFRGLDWLTDAEDVALRGFVTWKRWHWHEMEKRDAKRARSSLAEAAHRCSADLSTSA
jgi:hypothetical protein